MLCKDRGDGVSDDCVSSGAVRASRGSREVSSLESRNGRPQAKIQAPWFLTLTEADYTGIGLSGRLVKQTASGCSLAPRTLSASAHQGTHKASLFPCVVVYLSNSIMHHGPFVADYVVDALRSRIWPVSMHISNAINTAAPNLRSNGNALIKAMLLFLPSPASLRRPGMVNSSHSTPSDPTHAL